jgi:hypothetical protein
MQTDCISLEPQTVQLDFAVVNQTFAAIHQQNLSIHVVDLDNILVTEEVFKTLFYKQNVFSINPLVSQNPILIPFISFEHVHRTVNNTTFFLTETIIQNIENDLGMSRNLLTPCSNIALNKQLNAIKTLSDLIKTSSILCSLSWSDIVNTVRSKFNDLDPMPKAPDVILTLSVVFSSPTSGIQPTMVKFNYKTSITIG